MTSKIIPPPVFDRTPAHRYAPEGLPASAYLTLQLLRDGCDRETVARRLILTPGRVSTIITQLTRLNLVVRRRDTRDRRRTWFDVTERGKAVLFDLKTGQT